MRQMRWFGRRFSFTEPAGVFPAVLERLRGTPARLEERIHGVTPDVLSTRKDGAWSILEHIGHLGDLEDLWYRRVSDLLAGAETLSEADLTNRRTHEAQHNESSAEVLLARFRLERASLVARLEGMGEPDVVRSALHPRLRQPMRMIDHVLFVAEHDDHHLAVISELLRDG